MQSLLANTKVYPQIWHSVFRGLEVALAIHSFSCHNFSLWRVSGLVAPGLLLELCGWVLPLFVLLSDFMVHLLALRRWLVASFSPSADIYWKCSLDHRLRIGIRWF